jgi:hypothetical protein
MTSSNLPPSVMYLDPADVMFSQSSVSPEFSMSVAPNNTPENREITQHKPINVVPMPDGSIATFNNRRLLSARKRGIERVQVIVHQPDEPLPPSGMEMSHVRILWLAPPPTHRAIHPPLASTPGLHSVKLHVSTWQSLVAARCAAQHGGVGGRPFSLHGHREEPWVQGRSEQTSTMQRLATYAIGASDHQAMTMPRDLGMPTLKAAVQEGCTEFYVGSSRSDRRLYVARSDVGELLETVSEAEVAWYTFTSGGVVLRAAADVPDSIEPPGGEEREFWLELVAEEEALERMFAEELQQQAEEALSSAAQAGVANATSAAESASGQQLPTVDPGMVLDIYGGLQLQQQVKE